MQVLRSLSSVMRHGHGHRLRGTVARGVGTVHRERVTTSVPLLGTFRPELYRQVSSHHPVRLLLVFLRALDGFGARDRGDLTDRVRVTGIRV